ncbi:uncharacterized protein SCHCODRAFT_02498806 [Schizophyllum commune H4-8]|nr:uncharacterized protein SCHCODRAFT_02498806 [Schizophyllum commune H4-8]KAI5893213.1 hypothetical protein SCHCODRAFT_02498806 [Schizophyllum commune H4-8]
MVRPLSALGTPPPAPCATGSVDVQVDLLDGMENPVAPLGLSSPYPVATSTTFILSEPPASSEGQATVT